MEPLFDISKVKNLKEFKKLIHRYETITIEEIVSTLKSTDSFKEAKNKLTGFGYLYSCTLCIKTTMCCTKCIYIKDIGCNSIPTDTHLSYINIDKAKSIPELLKAYKERAEAMRVFYRKYYGKQLHIYKKDLS